MYVCMWFYFIIATLLHSFTRSFVANYICVSHSYMCVAYIATVNGERFAGLNFRRFQFLWENFRSALRLQRLNNAIIRSLYDINKY